jgi:FkbM family methyltransferase
MSCKYFILTKPKDRDVTDNKKNKIIHMNKLIFILPSNLLSYYSTHGLFESRLIEWSKKFCSSNKITLDIGAHSGTYSLCLANRSQHVYSFEPQRMTYYSLCGSVALSNLKNVTCHNFGLGSPEQVGENELFIVSNDGGGSTLIKNQSPVLSTETVSIRTLDSLGLTNIGFIKMDVEENELNVLKGAMETLKNSNYPTILFESNYINEELFNFIRQLSYNITQVSGVSNMFLATH